MQSAVTNLARVEGQTIGLFWHHWDRYDVGGLKRLQVEAYCRGRSTMYTQPTLFHMQPGSWREGVCVSTLYLALPTHLPPLPPKNLHLSTTLPPKAPNRRSPTHVDIIVTSNV